VNEPSRPSRVAVAHPRTFAARRARQLPVLPDPGVDSGLGELLLDSLLASQRRLIVRHLTRMIGFLAAMFFVLLIIGKSHLGSWGGIGLPWFLLGVGSFPVMWLLARSYVHDVETLEREFVDFVLRS
jgi:hypothetical protein